MTTCYSVQKKNSNTWWQEDIDCVSRLLSFPDVINWLNVGSLMFSNYIYLISLQCLYKLQCVKKLWAQIKKKYYSVFKKKIH